MVLTEGNRTGRFRCEGASRGRMGTNVRISVELELGVCRGNKGKELKSEKSDESTEESAEVLHGDDGV